MLALAAANDCSFADLKQVLGLTEAQCVRLAQLQPAIHNESTRLAIVEKCFAALHVHEWLHFPNTEVGRSASLCSTGHADAAVCDAVGSQVINVPLSLCLLAGVNQLLDLLKFAKYF
ncbi:hypothetical protein B5M09_010126 [Aphanomyces astaci]|uniref:Uncharacterized protein n=1 Tax=Aphanomyces astaci TaxID=112090 RepID=A0A425CVI5_APHAT|nr:hypothetical protein B5M09_010126 [Aphanomyces astaci]